jgi:hypothetical protein
MFSRLKSSPLFRSLVGWTCVGVGIILAIPFVPGPGIPLILLGLGILGKGGRLLARLKGRLERKGTRKAG